MEQEKQSAVREMISMEEYLIRRRKVREDAETSGNIEKSPAWILAELLHV